MSSLPWDGLHLKQHVVAKAKSKGNLWKNSSDHQSDFFCLMREGTHLMKTESYGCERPQCHKRGGEEIGGCKHVLAIRC